MRRLARKVARLRLLCEWTCVLHTARGDIALVTGALMSLYLAGSLSDPAMTATTSTWLVTITTDAVLDGVCTLYRRHVLHAIKETQL